MGDRLRMEIKGFVDLSLVDWDGRLCSVVFLPRCNFRCPFCHNVDLVLRPGEGEAVPLERVMGYLRRQGGWLDGVCVTGGEPTLHADLPEFCGRLKSVGLGVKLDTNGTNPRMVKDLIKEGLVDYVALDVKAPLRVERYSRAVGVDAKNLLGKVKETVELLLGGGVDYEFRTTVVPTLHDLGAIEEISREIRGCRRYVLQRFDVRAEKETLDPAFGRLEPFTDEEMRALLAAAQTYIPDAKIR